MEAKENERLFNFNLIKFVSENDILFNMNNSGYKDNDLKTKVFRKFANDNNIDVEFVMKRWINLRNSYQRVKRELREKPNKKSKKVWAYKDAMSFLDINDESLSSSPFYHQTKRPKNDSISDQILNGNNSKIGENEFLNSFTQTLNTYEGDLIEDEDDGNTEFSNTANSISTFNNSMTALPNNNELNQERLTINSDVLDGLNYLNENVKQLIKQQNKQFQAPKIVQDSVSLYLDTLKPLLKMFADDALKFAKLQTKINQLIINEIESNYSN